MQRPLPERQTSEQLRAEGREFRKRWADEVRQALDEQGLSVHACARRAGISPGALQAWLNQDVEPAPRAMAKLAQVLGRSHFRLVSLLGWLPEELGDVSLQFEATDKLRDALAEASRWVESATEVAGFSGGSILANAMLNASDDWRVTLRHSIRGTTYPTRFVTAVAFSRVDEPAPERAQAGTAADRAEIQQLLRRAIVRTGATWSRPERAAAWQVERPDLVMEAPVLLAGKPRGLRPNLVLPPTVMVAGVPFTGAPEVAALLATALDWAYTDVRMATRLAYGLSASSSAGEGLEVEIARRLLDEARPDAAGGAKFMAWSVYAPGALVATMDQLGAQLPLVVFLEAPEELLEFVEQRRGFGGARKAQNLIRGTLAARDRSTWLTIKVPSLPLPEEGDLHDVDLFFDAYVEQAFEAAAWLDRAHGGPPLDEAPGVIGELWRRRPATMADLGKSAFGG